MLAGHWWGAQDAGKPLVSISSEYQETLHLQVGDRISFDVAGETVEAAGRQCAQSALGQLPSEFLSGAAARCVGRRCREPT